MNVNLQAPLSTLFASTTVSETGSTLNTLEASGGVNFVSAGNNNLDLGVITTMGGTLNTNTLGSAGGNVVTTTAGNNYLGYYWNWWEPYNHYYHSCYHSHTTPDKFETAFKLSRKLMDKKAVKPMKTIEDFFKLMDTIVECL